MDKNIRYIVAIMLAVTGSVLAFMLVQHGIKMQNGDWGLGGVLTLIVSYAGSGIILHFDKILHEILY